MLPETRPGEMALSATGVLRTLTEAVRARRIVRIAYVDQAGERTRRDVEAQGVVLAPNGDYLVGWCRMRNAARLLRVDGAADCPDVLWHDPVPEPGLPGRSRPLADLLAGWWSPLSHIEWHLDRLADDPPVAPAGDDPYEEPDERLVRNCPLA